MKFKSYKNQGLLHRLWRCFAMFSMAIILTLWLLQIFFFNQYYESMKIRETEKLGNELSVLYTSNNVSEIPIQGIFRHGMMVRNINPDGSVIYPGRIPDNPGMRERTENKRNRTFIEKLNNSGKNHIVEIVTDDFRGNSKNIVYLSKVKDSSGNLHSYLLIQSPLTSTDTTVRVLKSQLIIVSCAIILISILISFFLAKRLSAPIIKVKDTALLLSEGEYSVKFEEGDYREINELAAVLNHTASELSKNEKLRRDLIANVSHDLRTPLTIIKSYGEMIIDISGENKEKREEHINVIIKEADRLSALVSDILDLSKIESGSVELNVEKFDISKTVKKICDQFKLSPQYTDYNFSFEADKIPDVLGNEARITQVIYNLINNAVNYTGEDKMVFIKLLSKENKVRFEVTDTGKGISKEDKIRVWERYYRASANNKREISGTGIGLAIVKNILNLHNAEYGVISEKGKGSTFWFELPSENA